MIKIFTPESEAELAVVQSILEAEGVHYLVSNYRSPKGGPGAGKNPFPRAIMAPPEEADRAREVIAAYQESVSIPETEWSFGVGKASPAILVKLRGIIRRLLSGR